MKHFIQPIFFALFAIASWCFIALLWLETLFDIFILSAALWAGGTGFVVSYFVPRDLFGRPRFLGWGISLLTSFLITTSTVIVAVPAMTMLQEASSFTTIVDNLMIIFFTLFVIPPVLIFWLVCVGGFHLYRRRNRHL